LLNDEDEEFPSRFKGVDVPNVPTVEDPILCRVPLPLGQSSKFTYSRSRVLSSDAVQETPVELLEAVIEAPSDAPADEGAADDVPTVDVPTVYVPTVDVPTVYVPTVDVPTVDVPSFVPPTDDAPIDDAPTDDTPEWIRLAMQTTNDAPVGDASVEVAPVGDASVEVAPVDDAPSDATRTMVEAKENAVDDEDGSSRQTDPAVDDFILIDVDCDKADTFFFDANSVEDETGSSQSSTVQQSQR
jgi:hypothetical protein